MQAEDTRDILKLLREARDGSAAAVDQLLPKVYDELRYLAGAYLNRERADHTLQPTALVHEAYLRLIGQRTVGWEDRAQFLAAAASVMRRILVDHARRTQAAKRGGHASRTPLDDAIATFEERAIDLISLDDALTQLAEVDRRKCQIVELRFFAGLTAEETARVLQVNVRTIEREWSVARAWLRSALQSS